MNEITMKMQADQLIRMALQNITSEDVSTNAVMPTATKGTVDLIAKEDGVNVPDLTFMREYLQSWMKKQRLIFTAKMEMK